MWRVERWLRLCGALPRRICVLVVHRQELTGGRDDFLAHDLEIALDQCARRTRVTTAGELAGELVDIDVASAAEGHLHLLMTEVSEEKRQPRSANRSRVLRDSLEIFRLESVLFGGAGSNGDPGYSVLWIDFQRRQCVAQQMQTTDRHRGIKPPVHLLRLDSRCDQLPGDAEATRSRVAEAEPAGIGQ